MAPSAPLSVSNGSNPLSSSGGATSVPKANQRKSLGGSSSAPLPPSSAAGQGRRSSTYGKSKSIKTDPRPINDKAWHNQCKKALIKYLSEKGTSVMMTM